LGSRLIISGACVVTAIAAGVLAADPTLNLVVKETFEQHQVHSDRGKSGSTQITYHGGAVMTGAPVKVYLIYYGALVTPAPPVPSTETVVNQFFSDLSNAAPYAVNSTYYDASGAKIAGSFYFNPIAYSASGSPTGSLYFDAAASQGTSIGSHTVPSIVQHAIKSGGLPVDSNGVYFVLTGPEIKVSGFCKSFCAYHTSSTSISPGMKIRYALVPDPGQACTGCDGNYSNYNQTVTPNGNQGADEMTDSIIHELSETVTDPDISAWYTASGAENGDLCNYVYGSGTLPRVPTGPGTGAYYNFASATGHYYLIQEIWSNVAPQACLSKLP